MKIFYKRALFLVPLIGLYVIPAMAAEVPTTKKWKDAAEVSVLSSNGNSRSTTSSGKNTFGYNWSQAALELIGGGQGSKSQGQVTSESYFASEKVSYKLSDRNYTFEKFAWDKDRFAGIANRYDSSVGLGRELIKNATDNLIAELGGGYVNEQRTNSPRNDFVSGRAYSKYTHTLSPTSNFSQDVEYLANFKHDDDFRVNTETALTAALNVHFSLKVSYTWKHVGRPPAGFGRNDTITSVALIANY